MNDSKIAEYAVVFVDPKGKEFKVTLSIGLPQLENDMWGCTVGFDGLPGGQAPTIRGDDSLQSLCQAVWFMRNRLHKLVQANWSILVEQADSEKSVTERYEFPLDAYFGRNGREP
jgi:hypothetical protein